MEKIEKDGRIAVLYSPGFGAGWSTWADDNQKEALCMDALGSAQRGGSLKTYPHRHRASRGVCRGGSAVNNPVKAIVGELNEDIRGVLSPTMKVGERIQHPDGYLVQVVSGRYLDPTYGTVTNWWTWRRVLEEGQLGPEESGYGW